VPYGIIRDTALKKALEDARARARQVADTLDVRLGKPTYVQTTGYLPPIPRTVHLEDVKAGAPLPETPISPGEMDVQVSVQVAYAIE
jgi:uncharacterized protein YggE